MKKFSIIIALAPYRSAPVIESLNKLDYPKKDYEIIIEKGLNPSENRNKGIKKSSGEILFFVDDDAEVNKNILKKAEEFFKQYNVDVVGGPQLTPESDSFFAKSSGYVMSSFFATHKMSNRYKKGKLNLDADESFLTSANLFIKKEVFNSTDGFNPNLWPGEDPELIARLKALNFKVAYSPDLIIYHKRRPTISSLFKQFYSYGKTSVQKEKLKSTKTSLLFFIPTLCFIYTLIYGILLITHLIGYFTFKLIFILSFPFLIYVFITMIMAFYLSIKNKNLLAFLILPSIYLIIHTSYGLGVIIGLLSKK